MSENLTAEKDHVNVIDLTNSDSENSQSDDYEIITLMPVRIVGPPPNTVNADDIEVSHTTTVDTSSSASSSLNSTSNLIASCPNDRVHGLQDTSSKSSSQAFAVNSHTSIHSSHCGLDSSVIQPVKRFKRPIRFFTQAASVSSGLVTEQTTFSQTTSEVTSSTLVSKEAVTTLPQPALPQPDCKLCFSIQENMVVIIPCGHICMCYTCSFRCSNCPICRQEIYEKNVFKVYFA